MKRDRKTPAVWLVTRARRFERKDLPFSTAIRAAAAELRPTRWAPRWELQPSVFQDRIMALVRLEGARRERECSGAGEPFRIAADRLDMTRGDGAGSESDGRVTTWVER